VYILGSWNGTSYVESYHYVDWAGDTTITSISYKKIHINGNYNGGVRQDTINQKIFYIDTQSNEHDVSINHNVTVGDTIVFHPEASNLYLPGLSNSPYNFPLDTVVITHIDSSSYFKKLYLTDYSNIGGMWYFDATYIEGIGFENITMFEAGYGLNCFRNESNLIYGDPFNPLCALSIENKQFINSNTFPNPTSNLLTIKYNNPNNIPYELAIYDNLGRKVHKSEFIINEEIEIDVRDLKNGIYHYTLYCPTQNLRSTGKFIKN
tara:strand:+ start:271 stop:1062 length:792 start_codon:yes stop_codon:yes gene_type:complete